MNSYINPKIASLRPYSFEEGADAVRLDANESYIALPDDKRIRFAEIARNLDYNRYPDALAQKTCAAFGKLIGVDSRFITPGNGSDELISIIINSFCEKGDRVMICDPDFSMYAFYCHLAQVECLPFEKTQDFTIDTQAAVEFANIHKPRLIIFSNPCSPTGQGLTREKTLEFIKGYKDAIYVVDEAYMDFWDQSIIPEALAAQNIIILKTCSKALGIAALRLGFAVACSGLTDGIRRAKSPVNVNALTQALALELLSDEKFCRACIDDIKAKTVLLYTGLRSLEDKYPERLKTWPTLCNFVYLNMGDAQNAHEKLRDNGIIVRRFGTKLRVTAGSDREREFFLQIFEKIIRGEL